MVELEKNRNGMEKDLAGLDLQLNCKKTYFRQLNVPGDTIHVLGVNIVRLQGAQCIPGIARGAQIIFRGWAPMNMSISEGLAGAVRIAVPGGQVPINSKKQYPFLSLAGYASELFYPCPIPTFFLVRR